MIPSKKSRENNLESNKQAMNETPKNTPENDTKITKS
jgi:hypothetical protein